MELGWDSGAIIALVTLFANLGYRWIESRVSQFRETKQAETEKEKARIESHSAIEQIVSARTENLFTQYEKEVARLEGLNARLDARVDEMMKHVDMLEKKINQRDIEILRITHRLQQYEPDFTPTSFKET